MRLGWAESETGMGGEFGFGLLPQMIQTDEGDQKQALPWSLGYTQLHNVEDLFYLTIIAAFTSSNASQAYFH